MFSQTTFTESAAAYNLNIGGNKDGGHAWADYDLDGDFDLVINTNGSGYLMRNDGATFTDVTSTLAPDFSGGDLERTALFVDFNNDGYPDIFRNDNNDIRIFLQDPATNRFGDGMGGTVPSQRFTSLTDGLNAEGAGALDYDGDGDLDIFIDNHNFGIDILQNDGNGFFTHVTRKADSPNPPYDVNDATTWPLGLVQDATDGDYGSATDFNDDGWVDIVVRKRNQVDLFTNIGGTFQDGTDIDDANNGNKGAVAFGDLDNDGDFDLFWTENGDNQIHRNNGDGTWTPMGSATGIPLSFSGQIEGLAFGDVDNDGDLDIFLTGNNVSGLYLNNGSGLNFTDSGLSFNNRGEGSTFIDIDNDGDLDLYQNRNGTNALYINNLGATARANHLFIDIKEDRDSFGLTGAEERFGIGATVKILDCGGNVISGTREVNGGFGHGTQESGIIHFGLPGGPNTPIVLEVGFPRTSSGRIVVRSQLTPSDFNNGSINLIDILPDVTNLDPIAQDDIISTSQMVSTTFDPLVDNGNGVDTDPENGTLEVIAITQPANGSAVLNADGTVTYNPGNFVGTTSFTYTLGDNPICSFSSGQDIGTVFVTVSAQPDSDGDGVFDSVDLDDDNDGILDSVECPNGMSILWVTQNTPNTEEQNTIDKLTALGYTVTVVDDGASGQDANNYAATFLFERVNSNTAFSNIANIATTTMGVITSENALHDEILGGVTGGNSGTSFVNITDNTHPITSGLTLGNYDIGNANFHGNGITSGTTLGTNPNNNEAAITIWDVGDALETGVALGRRVIVPHTRGFNSAGEDLLVNAIVWTAQRDTDKDGIIDCLDTDSDGDGCSDADEAYGDANTDLDNNGRYGTGNPAVNTDGTVSAASYQIPVDQDFSGMADFLEIGVSPVITTQPQFESICPNSDVSFSVTASNVDDYQWQLFNGSTWADLGDTGIYSGTATNTLQLSRVPISENGNQYRVIVSNSSFVCGAIASAVTTLTVADTNAPVITNCPADVTVSADAGTCTAIVNYPIVEATDDCPIFEDFDVANRSVLQGECWIFAGTVVTGSGAISGSGAMRTGVITNTATNQLTTPLIYFYGSGELKFDHRLTAFANDHRLSINLIDESGTVITPDFYNYTYVDANVQTVSIPINFSGNYRLRFDFKSNGNNNRRAYVDNLYLPGLYLASSSCSTVINPSILQVSGLASGSSFPFGVTTNTYEVTDALGNMVSCSFDVTVEDNQAPTASNPSPISVFCTSDIPTPDPLVVTDETDNCDLTPTVSFISDVSDGGSNPEIITRTYSVTDGSGNSINVTQTITVSSVQIATQPTAQTVFVGNNGSFNVNGINADTYQWQVSTDNGVNYSDIVDGTEYSGTQTSSLTVIAPDVDKNGYLFRVLLSNSTTVSCSPINSDAVLLTLRVNTVITNRRITYRVNKD